MPTKARSRRKRMRKYLKGNVDEVMPLSTLGPVSLTKTVFDETVKDRTFVSSMVASWSMAEFTKTQGDGPILVGIAHNDYTAAEIEEVIENAGSWNEGDLVSQEKSKRKVRIVGAFHTQAIAAGAISQLVLNDGKPIKTKIGWILNQGQTMAIWAYNQGSGTLTTGALVILNGHINLWPQ